MGRIKIKTISQQLNVKVFPFTIKDGDGNEIYYEDCNGYFCKREFNDMGRVTSVEYRDGTFRKCEYDKMGNITYMENSNNEWTKYEYDDYGNQTYIEHSNNEWTKYEYDNKGNITYLQNSSSYWGKCEYGENGDEIYVEDSVHGVTLDERPKSKCEGKVVEIDGKKYKLTEIKD